jgi:predicted DNA-binding transcriptional regulator YafY
MRINDLATRLGVNRRTVVRYVKALAATVDNDTGEPIIKRELRNSEAWAVLTETRIPVANGIFQYAATYAASRHLVTTHSLLSDGVDDVLDRLETALDTTPTELLDRVASGFYYVAWGPKDYSHNADVLDSVVQGILRCRPLDIVYRATAAEAAERRIEPFTLVMYRDGLYVLARVIRENGSDMRTYAIDRIETADLDRSTHFELPQDFSPRKYYANTLGLWQSNKAPVQVVLAFEESAAAVARERRWPGFSEWRLRDDARWHLTLKVPITPELESWILTWGQKMEVIEPLTLRQRVASHLKAALSAYQ